MHARRRRSTTCAPGGAYFDDHVIRRPAGVDGRRDRRRALGGAGWRLGLLRARAHARLLPALRASRSARTACVNLRVLWLKALAGDDAAYALLPRGARLLGPPLRRGYPRGSTTRSLHTLRAASWTTPSGTSCAAATTTWPSWRWGRASARAARAVDGPRAPARRVARRPARVIAQKRGVLGRAYGAELIACDLAGAGVEAALARRSRARRAASIFVVEALLIYLDAAAAERLLDACRGAPCAAVSLCFADRLAIDGVDEAAAARLFADRGFDLVRYLPKPGLARHMGVARRRPHAGS